MNGVKRFLKKKDIGMQKNNIFLMTWLLMNCQTLPDAGEILMDMFTVLSSRTLNEKNRFNYDRLMIFLTLFKLNQKPLRLPMKTLL